MKIGNFKRIVAGALSVCMLAACAPCLAEAGVILKTPVTAHAKTNDTIVTGNCDYSKITWKYNTNTKVITFTGTGEIPYLNSNKFQKYKREIKTIIISKGITAIGAENFQNCTALEKVQFGDVKTIDESAFKGCTALKSLHLNGKLKSIGKNAFSDCTNLTTVTVGPNVQSAYRDSFEGCDNLTSLTVNKKNPYLYAEGNTLLFSKFSGKCGKNVTFSYNAKNKTLTLSGSGAMSAGSYDCEDCEGDYDDYIDCEDVEMYNFYSSSPYEDVIQHEMKTLIVGDKITKITVGAFAQCDALKTVKLGKNVNTIEHFAFIGCKALETVHANKNIKSIESCAFSKCSNLKKINTLPNLTEIGYYSFSGCKKLKTFSIGKSVKTIGNGAFSECASLSKLSVHKNNKYFSKRNNMLLNKKQSKIVAACFGSNKTCNIYSSVTAIDEAILDDTSIEGFSVEPDNSMYSSVDGLLYSKDGTTLIKCPAAISGVVNIGDSVTTIDSTAFYTCNNITQINIGENVNKLSLDYKYFFVPNLDNIQISDKNAYYYSENGSLIQKANDELLYCYKINGDTYTIPDSIKEVHDYAFCGQTNLKKIILSNNIKITDVAFISYNKNTSGRSTIESIHLEKNYNNPTNYFGEFQFLDTLKEITVSDENPNYTSIEGVLYDKNAKELIYLPAAIETYTIPESVTGINSNCTSSLHGIKHLTLSNSITDATVWLDRCNDFDSSLESLHIGKNVNTLINDEFHKEYELKNSENYYLLFRSLKSISVDEENNYFKVVNNMLYTKDLSTFILCPAQTEGKIVLEEGVTKISEYAFEYCEKITDIVIPNTVSQVEDNAFDFSYNTEYVVVWVPKGKKKFYKSLFTKKTGFTSNMVIQELEN